MKHSTIKIRGFAILEILVATVILCGIVYAFLAFSQNQEKRIAQENTGKYLAILTNDIFESTLTSGNCSKSAVYSLTQCVAVSSQFKALMKDNGFDTDTATVQITNYSQLDMETYKNVTLVTIKFSSGHYSQVNASIYAQQLFDNLSPKSISRFSSMTPSDYWFTYAVANDSGTKVQTDGSTLYFYFNIENDYL